MMKYHCDCSSKEYFTEGRIVMSKRENKTKISVQESTIKQARDTRDSQSSKAIKKHREKLNFLASISTIVSSLVAIITLGVTICTLNTTTSINNTINAPLNNNQITQSGNLNITQYGDNSSIKISMDNALRYEIVDYKLGIEEEARLLSLAKRYFDAEDYQMAFSIYSSEDLKENDYATINRAYCYAHGYGVINDTELAMSLYDSVGSDDARRNKLALMIISNINGVYDTDILEEFDYFRSIKDYSVLNYLSLCKYGKSIDSISEESLEIELSDIYHYELVEEKLYTTGYSTFSSPYEKLVLVGAVAGSNTSGMKGIYYRYQLYRLHHLDWLERLFG